MQSWECLQIDFAAFLNVARHTSPLPQPVFQRDIGLKPVSCGSLNSLANSRILNRYLSQQSHEVNYCRQSGGNSSGLAETVQMEKFLPTAEPNGAWFRIALNQGFE